MRRKTCEFCEKRFKNLKLHMRRSNCGRTITAGAGEQLGILSKVSEPPIEKVVTKLNFYGHTEIHMQESNRPRTQY